MFQGTQAWNFFSFCAETESLWSQGPRECWKLYSIRLRYPTFKHFCVCSASIEIMSAYAKPAMKFISRMLSIFWMMILNWAVICPSAEHARKEVTSWLHAQILAACWLSMHKNWLLVGCAFAKFFYSLAEHTQNHCGAPHTFCTCLPSYIPCLTFLFLVSRPLSPVSCTCLLLSYHPLSPVLRLCSLSPVLCPLSQVSVPFLPSAVPSLCSLYPVLYPMSHGSAHCL